MVCLMNFPTHRTGNMVDTYATYTTNYYYCCTYEHSHSCRSGYETSSYYYYTVEKGVEKYARLRRKLLFSSRITALPRTYRIPDRYPAVRATITTASTPAHPCAIPVLYTPQLPHLGNVARHNESFAPRRPDLLGNGLEFVLCSG